MARNPFSLDGVDGGVLFIDGNVSGSIRHRLKASYAARAHGANWSRHGIVEGELNDFAVTVDASRVVTVASGFCYVEHNDGIKYGVVNEANKTIQLNAPGSVARTDAIVVTINTTDVEATIVKEDGPNLGGNPATPANSLVLAYVTVPPSGNPTVSLPATRFAVPKGTTTVAGGTSGGGASGRRATQRFSGETSARAVMHNDRLYSRDATKRWLLDGDNNLLEFDLEEYGFVRNDTPARTFGGNSAGRPLMSFWDEANGNLWALKGDRAHIIESDTASRVTTGSSSISLTIVAVNVRWNFDDFGDDRGLGIQSGGRMFVVGNPNGARNALVGEYTIVQPAATTINALSIQANADALVRHTGNVTLPVRLIAAGDAGSILAAWLATADVANIHTVAQNGRIEQWSGTGVKDAATYAELPEGRRPEGGVFNLAVTRGAATGGAAYELGPPPNYNSQATLTGDSVQVNNALNGRVPANIRALYDANSRYVFVQYGSDNNFHAYNRQSNSWTEISPFPIIDNYRGQTGTATVTNPEGVNGIFTLTRIDGVLCFSGPRTHPARAQSRRPDGLLAI